MGSREQTPPYYAAAQEVLTELGLRDRCRLSDATARQELYRWCLLFELGGGAFTVQGDEDGTDPTERQLIKHKVRAEVLDRINTSGL